MNSHQDKFDALLDQNIDEKTRKTYLEEINANPIMKAEFESYKDVFKLANILERRTIKEEIKKIHKDDSVNRNSSNVWKKLFGIILAIITVLAILYMLKSKSAPINSSQIAAKYFAAYPDKITSMGENEINLSSYNQNNYDQALIDLESNPGYEASFYRAICHIAIKEYATAEKILRDIKNEIPQSYAQALDWYLALAMIGNDKSDEAKPILDSFANDTKSDYQKEAARELLKRIK